jgi:hypothetical protein
MNPHLKTSLILGGFLAFVAVCVKWPVVIVVASGLLVLSAFYGIIYTNVTSSPVSGMW